MIARRLRAIGLVVGDLDRAVRFYADALGFGAGARERRGGATVCTLMLAGERVELLAFDKAGAPYPSDSRSNDLWFQHFAVVVPDMRTACARVEACAGFSAITRDGPQRLPASSGGVVAFKFRDPDGHPLELLAFPGGGVGFGINHSAIGVSDTAASVAFYERELGLRVGARSLNAGPEQARLDDVEAPVVEVTGLEVGAGGGPHVELLCYRQPMGGRRSDVADNDIAATRLVFAGDVDAARVTRDPDGHRLVVEPVS
jgi:catechol 2,3-dioxygenase-like lactoylglutathione lyase family enzyme